MMEGFIIDAILKIGNCKKVKKICEPQVMQPLQLEKWMVVRMLGAVKLIEEAYESNKDIS